MEKNLMDFLMDKLTTDHVVKIYPLTREYGDIIIDCSNISGEDEIIQRFKIPVVSNKLEDIEDRIIFSIDTCIDSVDRMAEEINE